MAAADAANEARLTQPNIFDAALRSWQQTQQAAQLMGTNRPPVATLTSPTPVATSTVQRGSTGTSAVPGAAAVAQQQYQADLAAAAAQNFAQRAAAREVFSQGITQAQGGAADIYGGRAPALLGQAVTGNQRDLLINQAAEELRYQAAQEALRRAYSEAVGSAYQGLAANAINNANSRSAVAAQINRLGIG